MQLFIQRLYERDCNLNNNGEIHPETSWAATESSVYFVKGIQVEKKQRQAPVLKLIHIITTYSESLLLLSLKVG